MACDISEHAAVQFRTVCCVYTAEGKFESAADGVASEGQSADRWW